MQSEFYPRALHILRELAGGGVIQVPSSYKELLAPETAPDVKRYVRSPGVPAEERIKLYKLAWDMVGTEFAGRHELYERNYFGNHESIRFETLMVSDLTGASAKYKGFAEQCMAEYDLTGWTVPDLINPDDVSVVMKKRNVTA